MILSPYTFILANVLVLKAAKSKIRAHDFFFPLCTHTSEGAQQHIEVFVLYFLIMSLCMAQVLIKLLVLLLTL